MSDDPLDEFFSLPQSGKEWDPTTVRLIVSLMQKDLLVLKRDVTDVKTDLKDNYAPKSKLDLLEERVRKPIQMAYGLATLILVLFITAVAALVMRGHPGG